jgi:hypothetical protein
MVDGAVGAAIGSMPRQLPPDRGRLRVAMPRSVVPDALSSGLDGPMLSVTMASCAATKRR